MSMKHEGRGMTWSREEVKTLLDIWGEDDVQLELEGVVRNKHVYDRIARKLCDRGIVYVRK